MSRLQQLILSYEPWYLVVELAVIWICVYIVFRFLQGTRGAGVIKGFAIVLVATTITVRVLAGMSDAFTRLDFLYDRFLAIVAILLIVVFQPELRQAMSRLGHSLHFRGSKSGVHTVVDAVAQAVEFLSKSQFGALIAVERTSRLGGIVESGVELDAKVDARLLESIFWPNSPLHDLGVVIRGDRIVAASVQFPLAEEGVISAKFGSRHRAAVGLSLDGDSVIVIVSEETGAISIAEHGELLHDIPRDQIRAALARRLESPPDDGGGGGEGHDKAGADSDKDRKRTPEPERHADPDEKRAA